MSLAVSLAVAATSIFPRIFPYNADYWEIIDEKGKVHDVVCNPITGAPGNKQWTIAPGRHGNTNAFLGRTKYCFKEGVLSSIESPGGATRFFNPPARLDGGIAALFPDGPAGKNDAEKDKGLSDEIWAESDRFNAFYGNPNKTAMLFVQLALVLLAAAVALPRRGSVLRIAGAAVCAAGAAGCAVCMFMTWSRGGFVALAAGVAILATRFLRFTPRRIAIAAAALALAGCALWFAPGSERWTKNLFKVDESNSLRVNIMKAFPRMLHDAPEGWGAGNSGAAYVTWYRPDGEMHLVRALVSTHFTWLAEAGWPGRFAYIAGWLFVFCVSGRAWREGKPLPAAITAAFATAMTFNHAGEEWTLWIAPAVCVAPAAIRYPVLHKSGAACMAICSTAAALCICGILHHEGSPRKNTPSIRKSGALVFVNENRAVANGNTNTVYIASDSFATGGWMFAGKELLAFCENSYGLPAVAVTDETMDGIPDKVPRLVLTGRACREYMRRMNAGEPCCRPDSLLMISPACDISEIAPAAARTPRFRAIAGSLAMRRMKDPDFRPEWLRVVKGVELYIPNWLGIAVH